MFLLKSVFDVTDTKVPIISKIIALKQKLPEAQESIIIPANIPSKADAMGE